MAENTTLQKIADVYENNPTIRALIQVAMSPIPYGIGSAIDSALTTKIENMREERLKTFFNELANGSIELTEDVIQKEDFLHAYFSTLKAAVNTHKKEKIQLFARLLSTATKEKYLGNDIFDEFLDILDNLSIRELQILLILKYFEDAHPHKTKENGEMENDMQRAVSFWENFETEVEAKCGLGTEELRAALNRLNRTGFYETLTGYLDTTGGIGKLSPVFSQFAQWIQAKSEDLANSSS